MSYGKLIAGVAAIATGAAINASGILEDRGEGDNFAIRGVVENVGEHSVELQVNEIDVAKGDAEDWFREGNKHRIHDNYRACSLTSRVTGKPKEHKTSKSFIDIEGQPMTLRAVRNGSEVVITGRTIDSYSKCKTSKHNRSKFEKRPTMETFEVVG